jgi:sporulation protein YlmC with PRC-barrel domain
MRVNTGSDLFDSEGHKVGTITDVVFESTTLKPEWYDVKLGRLGGHHLVPVRSVTVVEGHGVVPFDKAVIKSAPGTSSPPLEEEKQTLLAHYRAA